MAVRSVQNEIAGGAVMTMNIIATAQGTIVKDDIVKLSNSSNFAVGTTASQDDLIDCGIVRKVSDDSALATVQFFHYNSCVELAYSGTAAAALRGSQVRMGSGIACDKVVSSGIAGDENYLTAYSGSNVYVLFR